MRLPQPVSGEIGQMVESLIRTGKYKSVDAVICEAVRLLFEQEKPIEPSQVGQRVRMKMI